MLGSLGPQRNCLAIYVAAGSGREIGAHPHHTLAHDTRPPVLRAFRAASRSDSIGSL
jgi:hypothetical protein